MGISRRGVQPTDRKRSAALASANSVTTTPTAPANLSHWPSTGNDWAEIKGTGLANAEFLGVLWLDTAFGLSFGFARAESGKVS